MKSVRASTLERAVRKLVSEKPDACYSIPSGPCQYTTGLAGGKVGCIIGQAIKMVRPDIWKLLEAMEKAGRSCTIDDVFPDFRISGNVKWLRAVQLSQDCGTTWSKAVAKADKEHGNASK